MFEDNSEIDIEVTFQTVFKSVCIEVTCEPAVKYTCKVVVDPAGAVGWVVFDVGRL